jgi:hypothetical protein
MTAFLPTLGVRVTDTYGGLMMRMNRRRVAISVAGAAGVLAVGIAVPTLAFAQDSTPSPAPSASTTAAAPDPSQQRAKHQDELASALAKELGIDKDKVAAALAKVEAAREADHPKPDGHGRPGQPGVDLKTRLDEAVKAGKITQAEADAITKAFDAGVLGGPRGAGPGGK